MFLRQSIDRYLRESRLLSAAFGCLCQSEFHKFAFSFRSLHRAIELAYDILIHFLLFS